MATNGRMKQKIVCQSEKMRLVYPSFTNIFLDVVGIETELETRTVEVFTIPR